MFLGAAALELYLFVQGIAVLQCWVLVLLYSADIDLVLLEQTWAESLFAPHSSGGGKDYWKYPVTGS